MPERTEEEKLTQSPIEVVLGGVTYEVKPLVITKARPWRTHYSEALASLSGSLTATSDDPAAFRTGLDALLVNGSDSVIDLFFEYATELDRDTIENSATEVEMAKAFQQLVEIAFPLAQSLVGKGITPETQEPPPNRAARRRRP